MLAEREIFLTYIHLEKSGFEFLGLSSEKDASYVARDKWSSILKRDSTA